MLKKIFLLAAVLGSIGWMSSVAVGQIDMMGGNSRTERRIRSEILSLPYYNVFDAIGYNLTGNTVTLSGWVVRPTTKDVAENIIEDIDGVSRVVNNIEVLPLSLSDDRIRRRTLQALSGRGGSLMYYFLGSNPSIRIIVNRGRIRLEGYVNNSGDKNLANILARGVSGAFGVTNNLKVIGDTP